MVADRLEEVGFSQPAAAVDEERVVGPRRGLGHGHRGRVRKLVVRADHERVECIARVHPRRTRGGGFFLCGPVGGSRANRQIVIRGDGGEMHGSHRGDDLPDRFFQDGKIVALDEKLVDRVRHAKRDRVPVVRRSGDPREPALVSVRTHSPANPRGNVRPNILCLCDHCLFRGLVKSFTASNTMLSRGGLKIKTPGSAAQEKTPDSEG